MTEVIVEASVKQTATFIFLHGFTENGQVWADEFKKIIPKHCKLICPNAEKMPISFKDGEMMPSWYEFYAVGPDTIHNDIGIKKASARLNDLIDKEIKNGIPAERIIIGGYSQGGSVAFYTTLTRGGCGTSSSGCGGSIAGVVAFSTWVPLRDQFQQNPNTLHVKKSVQAFYAHGDQDEFVPVATAKISAEFLTKVAGLQSVQFKVYAGMTHFTHFATKEAMNDLRTFITKLIP